MIVYHLQDGPVRFNELRRRIGEVTQRMLTNQLRELEIDGLLERKVFAQVANPKANRLTPRRSLARESRMVRH